ncbi:hypothetical protein M422DRAFT_46541 [Sphaerobolus stellatus SS14]|uniref:Uncharacterized protein n=1 Tax=Sphaerobolus stellatus (strain SS14) TaxID=990650 RepID=A0A0C9URG7_SPHS4|nr:hypothetical protein M422DRAFT_46541 [Sphaerobolus stellatus SS14]
MPSACFDHQSSWIVLWKASLVIELPPWVMFIYPSSPFFHFNIDIQDIKFVITNGDRPTPANSEPMNEDEHGRGSLVFFNQATMFQSSETGKGTLVEAKKAGHSSKTDYAIDVQAAFEHHSTMYCCKYKCNMFALVNI